jgi:hypothetical protein
MGVILNRFAYTLQFTGSIGQLFIFFKDNTTQRYLLVAFTYIIFLDKLKTEITFD